MAVHYTKDLIGRVKRAGLRLVTIDAGGGIRWQGGVPETIQLDLIDMVRQLKESAPDGLSAEPELTERPDQPMLPLIEPINSEPPPVTTPNPIPATPGTMSEPKTAPRPSHNGKAKPRPKPHRKSR